MVKTYRFEIEVQVSGKQLFPSPQRQQSERTQQQRYQHGQKAQNRLFEKKGEVEDAVTTCGQRTKRTYRGRSTCFVHVNKACVLTNDGGMNVVVGQFFSNE